MGRPNYGILSTDLFLPLFPHSLKPSWFPRLYFFLRLLLMRSEECIFPIVSYHSSALSSRRKATAGSLFHPHLFLPSIRVYLVLIILHCLQIFFLLCLHFMVVFFREGVLLGLQTINTKSRSPHIIYLGLSPFYRLSNMYYIYSSIFNTDHISVVQVD